MGAQFATEDAAADDDYFVRLLAFIWRFRGICVLILAMGAGAGVAVQSRSLPLRTTLSLRLVSPCVAYRHSDYWTPSGKAWRSQLTAGATKYAEPRLQITVHAGQDPWLLKVTADHNARDAVEDVLRNLVRETEEQLGVTRGMPLWSNALNSETAPPASNPAGLMVQLRLKLTRLEELLAENSSQDVEKSAIVPPARTQFPPLSFSGTWSPVPVQSVPYLPWFERLQGQVCEQLSGAASGKLSGQLTGEEQQEMALNLEQAAMLVSQVWFSMDPLNPVQQLPQGQIQSVTHAPNTDVSMLLAAGRGCWYACAFVLVGAMLGEWLAAKRRMIVRDPKLVLPDEQCDSLPTTH